MTKNEKAHLEANYKMYVENAMQAKADTEKHPDDQELAVRAKAHWNIVYGYEQAAVTVLMMSLDEDGAQQQVAAWRKEATDDYKRGDH